MLPISCIVNTLKRDLVCHLFEIIYFKFKKWQSRFFQIVQNYHSTVINKTWT